MSTATRLMELSTPHIPLGSSLAEALTVIERFGKPILDNCEDELCHRIETASFRMAVYPKGDVVGSVWYDDPIGRGTESGRAQKVEAYLKRYGPIQHWELRMDNGWMHFWFDPTDRAQMVYGVHNDVIRFNHYQE